VANTSSRALLGPAFFRAQFLSSKAFLFKAFFVQGIFVQVFFHPSFSSTGQVLRD